MAVAVTDPVDVSNCVGVLLVVCDEVTTAVPVEVLVGVGVGETVFSPVWLVVIDDVPVAVRERLLVEVGRSVLVVVAVDVPDVVQVIVPVFSPVWLVVVLLVPVSVMVLLAVPVGAGVSDCVSDAEDDRVAVFESVLPAVEDLVSVAEVVPVATGLGLMLPLRVKVSLAVLEALKVAG